jgi:hypothetical protein
VAASAVGGITALNAARYWSDTLTMMRGHTAATQAEMLDRTRVLLDLLRDRSQWPGR